MNSTVIDLTEKRLQKIKAELKEMTNETLAERIQKLVSSDRAMDKLIAELYPEADVNEFKRRRKE